MWAGTEGAFRLRYFAIVSGVSGSLTGLGSLIRLVNHGRDTGGEGPLACVILMWLGNRLGRTFARGAVTSAFTRTHILVANFHVSLYVAAA